MTSLSDLGAIANLCEEPDYFSMKQIIPHPDQQVCLGLHRMEQQPMALEIVMLPWPLHSRVFVQVICAVPWLSGLDLCLCSCICRISFKQLSLTIFSRTHLGGYLPTLIVPPSHLQHVPPQRDNTCPGIWIGCCSQRPPQPSSSCYDACGVWDPNRDEVLCEGLARQETGTRTPVLLRDTD